VDQAKQIHQCAIKNAGFTSLDSAYVIIFRKEWVALCTMKELTPICSYQSGGYSMKEVGAYFGVHYLSVSKIIKQAENSQFKT